jgi:nitroimidazol reductase NimA-like FMN-containing flavoprotein (pyridoxamine 5'-phosphate oxidase superfamily)
MEISDLGKDECWTFLGERRLGRLACCRDGNPYVVPLSFAVQRPYLYAFTTVGQKTTYLRANDAVCVQFDDIISPQSWLSVVVNGKFQELTEAADQDHAHAILETAVWWEPGYVRTTVRGSVRTATPVYFRILADEISGRRGTPSY